MSDDGRSQFQLSYQISPIILTGGIAANLPGGLMPIISLTQARDFSGGVTYVFDGSQAATVAGVVGAPSPDNFFAQFEPMSGATLIDNQYGKYPFANQRTAANAIIVQALHISLHMICPVREAGGYQQKLSVLSALKKSLDLHGNSGGTYTVATPSYLYTDCLLTSLHDVTSDGEKQKQTRWQWDFEQPLITLAAAQQAQNSLMQKVSSQTAVQGDPPQWSGLQTSVGQPASGTGPSVVPAAQGTAGSSVYGKGPPS